MSTKTLRKRIALVAVAALGFGVVTGVAANAAPVTAWTAGTAATDTTAITLASATSTPTAGAAVTVNVGLAVGTVASGADATHGIFATYTGYVSAYPAGGFTQATASATASGTTTAITGGTTTAATNSITIQQTTAGTGFTATTVTASSTLGVGKFTFTPPIAGTYTLKVWNDAGNTPDSLIGYNEAVQTIDIVVAARAAASASLSTVYQASALLPAAGTYAPSSTTDGTIYSTTAPVPTLCSKTTGTQCANLLATVKDSANNAISTGWVFGAEISGSGNLGITDTDATYTTAATARSVSILLPANNIFNVSVWPDGTAGVGKVTVYAADSDGNKVVLATKTVQFYGTVAKLAVVAGSQNYKILKAGKGTATGIITGLTATSDTPALTLAATDSAGNPVAGLTITATSSDLSVVSGSSIGEDLVAADAGYLYGAQGYYNADVTSAAGSVSGQKATVTYTTVTSTGAKISTTADFTIGDVVSKEVLSFDKPSYAPGEAVNLTITATDSKGNPVYDGAASPAVSFSKAMGGTAVAASTYLGGKKSTTSSKGVPSVFAPIITGSFSALATSTNAAASAISASATVTADNTAQAATDAAIASLIAKINALSKLIAKIQKKLGVK